MAAAAAAAAGASTTAVRESEAVATVETQKAPRVPKEAPARDARWPAGPPLLRVHILPGDVGLPASAARMRQTQHATPICGSRTDGKEVL
ncbi:unnamed protein product [Prorocentrum cordatum]|uniref:Secreted protein n=1 Tax=Prorocentrum cordatum TaxID=2364126 RepID=A0ABN9SSS8_9DINO|nr:unnamed protein product [Polarella glacialis]